MTKQTFRRFAEEAIQDAMNMPDEVWQHTYPMIRIKIGDETVVVGIEGKEDEKP